MTITAPDFDYVVDLVRVRAAIVLDPGKEYLAETRLETVARGAGFGSIGDLVAQLRQGHAELEEQVVDAMTTNETSFFRDLHPFVSLRDHVLPELIDRRRTSRTLRVWSAAASSGQEAYSIAMLLREHFPELDGWDVTILASDISQSMLQRVAEGRYSQLEVNRGLPAKMLVRWFGRSGAGWRVDRSLQRLVHPRYVHLAGAWPVLPTFDIVFLRNVLIYFGIETKQAVLDKVSLLMRPDGFMVLGAAETLLHIHNGFERVQLGKTSWHRPAPCSRGSER
jgi:chemotaxis protein methyltransferase CheR